MGIVTAKAGTEFPLLVRLPEGWELTDDAVLKLSALNEEWRIEADGDGGLHVLPPRRNADRRTINGDRGAVAALERPQRPRNGRRPGVLLPPQRLAALAPCGMDQRRTPGDY